MTPNKPIGLILAGGHSRRFGTDKALYRPTPKALPQVQQMALILAPLVSQIFVSVNHHNQSAITKLFANDNATTVLADQAPFVDQGPLSGIYATCHYLKTTTDFLMVPTDYPKLETATLNQLLKQPCYPVVDQRSHQTIAHFETNENAVEHYLNTGQRRVRIFLTEACGCQPFVLASNYQPQFTNYNQRSGQND
ncbi:molybdenum cofactor guanylyltransferase [Agrilactobacillus yilanensis]|uniref:Molybdenum cofactor guanylyltransferase n=2 Tax=Agrilactobacillus yilanensis TaxID=2485997 RepID=A0ABW4J8E9_9LACO